MDFSINKKSQVLKSLRCVKTKNFKILISYCLTLKFSLRFPGKEKFKLVTSLTHYHKENNFKFSDLPNFKIPTNVHLTLHQLGFSQVEEIFFEKES